MSTTCNTPPKVADSAAKPLTEKNTPLLLFLAKTGAPRAHWTEQIMAHTQCSRAAACAMLSGARERDTPTARKIARAAASLPATWTSYMLLSMLRPDPQLLSGSGAARLTVPLNWQRALLLVELLGSLAADNCLQQPLQRGSLGLRTQT